MLRLRPVCDQDNRSRKPSRSEKWVIRGFTCVTESMFIPTLVSWAVMACLEQSEG